MLGVDSNKTTRENETMQEATYTLDEKETESMYVRFVTGNDKGRVAKVCGMNLGGRGTIGGSGTIDVVIFLDGHNSWNFVHSHLKRGDRVEIVEGPLTLPVQQGVVAADEREEVKSREMRAALVCEGCYCDPCECLPDDCNCDPG